jgi:hypothetical protein
VHINRYHYAVSLCGEEINKSKLGTAIVTMDACDSEKLSDLNIEPPMTLKETFLTGFSQHNKTFQLDIKAIQVAC